MFDQIRHSYQQQTITPQQRYDQALLKVKANDGVFISPPQPTTVPDYDASKPLSGMMISVKDTFDVAGQTTQAGSCVPMSPAAENAPCIDALVADGAVLFGRTNMSEFAFSGLGINPHYGTPPNHFDAQKIPGGSTSGGAISVANGLCDAALGTDTGGSLRIPAAFNGLVGFKPCTTSVKRQGCFPLSPSLDCVGPMAHCVADCIKVWQSLSDHRQSVTPTQPINLISVENIVFDRADQQVVNGYKEAMAKLTDAGFGVQTRAIDVLDEVFAINSQGGLVLPESAWVHEHLLKQYGHLYDPLIAARIQSGGETALTDYIDRLQQRPMLQSAYAQTLGQDALLICPTVAILPPNLDAVVDSPQSFAYFNKLALRNTALFNYLDVPSITIPFYSSHTTLPIGVMLCGHQGQEAALLAAALSVEQALTN